jgi:peptidoglycan/xylan/chitin deacetylase (PgdA/CDA1 family)
MRKSFVGGSTASARKKAVQKSGAPVIDQKPVVTIIDGRLIAAVSAVVLAAPLLWGCAVDAKLAPGKPVDAASASALAPGPSAGAARSIVLPILVYHHVRPGSTSTLFVSPEVFDEELNYLQYYGFHTISFTDLADYLEKGKPLPPNPFIISLDDGWENQFEYGFPILQKYHDTATFYVVTDYLDHQNFMTTEQLKTMVAAGMTIGCHTRSHPYLTSLGRERAWDEIAGAKAILEADGFNIDTFAYPYGAYNARVVDMVQEAGFRTARTVDAGTRATAANLEKLPGMTFQTFINSYISQVTLTSGEALRQGWIDEASDGPAAHF